MRFRIAVLAIVAVATAAAPAFSQGYTQYEDVPHGNLAASLAFGYANTSTPAGTYHTFTAAPGFRMMVSRRLAIGAAFAYDLTTGPYENHTRMYYGGSLDYYVGHPDWIDAEFYPFAQGAIGVVHAASNHPFYWYENVGLSAHVGFGAHIMVARDVAVTPILMYVFEDTNYYRRDGQVILMVSIDAFFAHGR